MSDSEIWDERLSPRKRINTPVEFTIEADSFTATSLDISECGIRVQSNTPLPFNVKIKMPDGVEEKKATLVWAKNTEDGTMNYGMQFIED